MSELVALTAEIREELGTGSARSLRRKGMVPAVVYGAGKKNLAVAVEEKEITKLYRKPGFTSTVIQLEVNEKKHKVIAKAAELHPITDIVRHVDFVFLDSKTQKVEVPVTFEGRDKSIGLKRGGFLNIIKRKVHLLCPAGNIPKSIVIDVGNMFIGHSIKASNVTLPEGCEFVNKANFVIASMTGRGGKAEATEEAAKA